MCLGLHPPRFMKVHGVRRSGVAHVVPQHRRVQLSAGRRSLAALPRLRRPARQPLQPQFSSRPSQCPFKVDRVDSLNILQGPQCSSCLRPLPRPHRLPPQPLSEQAFRPLMLASESASRRRCEPPGRGVSKVRSPRPLLAPFFNSPSGRARRATARTALRGKRSLPLSLLAKVKGYPWDFPVESGETAEKS